MPAAQNLFEWRSNPAASSLQRNLSGQTCTLDNRGMQFPRSSALRTICFVLVVATAIALGQSREFVAITPHAATMTVGDSRTFRFVNQDGHMEHDVAWAISDSTALETSGGDEVTVTTKRAGEFRLR